MIRDLATPHERSADFRFFDLYLPNFKEVLNGLVERRQRLLETLPPYSREARRIRVFLRHHEEFQQLPSRR